MIDLRDLSTQPLKMFATLVWLLRDAAPQTRHQPALSSFPHLPWFSISSTQLSHVAACQVQNDSHFQSRKSPKYQACTKQRAT